MSIESKRVRCGSCGAELSGPASTSTNERKDCPFCGSRSRLFSIALSGIGKARSMLRLKGRRAKGGKPFIEQKVGDDLHRKSGRWMRLERLIDRVKNWYREIVKDRETGEILDRCEEPLDQHRGHGAANRKSDPTIRD